MGQKKKNAAKVSANAVAATTLAPAVLDEIQAAIANAIEGCHCGCVLTAGIDTQADRLSCVVSGCKQNGDSYFDIELDLRQKEIERLKNNEDWHRAASLGALMLIAPEINALLMKALEERDIEPTPYNVHNLAVFIQRLSSAAL